MMLPYLLKSQELVNLFPPPHSQAPFSSTHEDKYWTKGDNCLEFHKSIVYLIKLQKNKLFSN